MSYRITITDPADADAESIFNCLFGFNLTAAFRFRDALAENVRTLADNPNGYPIAEESGLYGRTVRRKLFRSGKSGYRLLFSVYEAGERGPDIGAEVIVLRVLHGAARPLTDTDENARSA